MISRFFVVMLFCIFLTGCIFFRYIQLVEENKYLKAQQLPLVYCAPDVVMCPKCKTMILPTRKPSQAKFLYEEHK